MRRLKKFISGIVDNTLFVCNVQQFTRPADARFVGGFASYFHGVKHGIEQVYTEDQMNRRAVYCFGEKADGWSLEFYKHLYNEKKKTTTAKYYYVDGERRWAKFYYGYSQKERRQFHEENKHLPKVKMTVRHNGKIIRVEYRHRQPDMRYGIAYISTIREPHGKNEWQYADTTKEIVFL